MIELLNLSDVSCGYGTKVILRHVNLSISQGESICVLGQNGVGKTTLFNTLLGFQRPLDGTIAVNGHNLSELTIAERAQLFSYVPQTYSYSYEFTVLEMVLMGRASHIETFSQPKATDIESARRSLNFLGLKDFENRRFSELSGGERQIVLVARALAQDSSFVIMDEPSSNLDYVNKGRLASAIRRLIDSGKGVLMTSHAPEQAFESCSKVLLISRSGIVKFGPTNEILSEDNVSEVYGIPIHIIDYLTNDGRVLHACLPDYKEGGYPC